MGSDPIIPDPPNGPRWLSLALILTALLAVLAGVFDPSSSAKPALREPANQVAMDEADEQAGFARKAGPDYPPRGPGP